MTIRPRSHQLETESRRVFANSLPSVWVLREISPDYGIDALVEIFSATGQATGKLFLVQLKATDGRSDELSVRLPVKTVAYYQTLLVPVLVVLFHAPSGRMYARWAARDAVAGKGAHPRKSVVIRFRATDLLDPPRLLGFKQDLHRLDRAVRLGERTLRIRRYYEGKRRATPWQRAPRRARRIPELRAGARVFHPAFGYGAIEEVSDFGAFVAFDLEEISHKFLPGEFAELIPIPRIPRRPRPNKRLQPSTAGAIMSRRG
jgi:hypothetical protein